MQKIIDPRYRAGHLTSLLLEEERVLYGGKKNDCFLVVS